MSKARDSGTAIKMVRLDFSARTWKEFLYIKDLVGSSKPARLIALALALYKNLMEMQNEGWVFYRECEGERIEIEFLRDTKGVDNPVRLVN